MALHIINKTDPTLWQLLQSAIHPKDAVLLIEDAVYVALPTYPLTPGLYALLPQLPCHVLAEDLAARGISAKIRPEFASVSYREFVALCLLHDKVVNWQ